MSLGPSSEDPVLPHTQPPGGPGPSLLMSKPSQPWISSLMILENYATVLSSHTIESPRKVRRANPNNIC